VIVFGGCWFFVLFLLVVIVGLVFVFGCDLDWFVWVISLFGWDLGCVVLVWLVCLCDFGWLVLFGSFWAWFVGCMC